MISRSLGPEFGGSIGLMFFLAKVCACGEYVLGLVEAILDVFGSDPGTRLCWYYLSHMHPSSSFQWTFACVVIVLLFLPVCACHRLPCVCGSAGASPGLLVHSAVLLHHPGVVSDRVPGGRPHLLAHRLRHPAADHRILAIHLHQLSGGQTSGFCYHPPVIGQPDRPLQH